ncbi:hypothetical protein RRG08_010577 [Elysia crispata]|uniref:Uncharacterized protein n=1 Tax=Elysia crispata TaxID=231223 RepID=A0AAE1DLW2_9GAST|nr:hypothetical protein RRG08_010577 [Elysia crispata]
MSSRTYLGDSTNRRLWNNKGFIVNRSGPSRVRLVRHGTLIASTPQRSETEPFGTLREGLKGWGKVIGQVLMVPFSVRVLPRGRSLLAAAWRRNTSSLTGACSLARAFCLFSIRARPEALPAVPKSRGQNSARPPPHDANWQEVTSYGD